MVALEAGFTGSSTEEAEALLLLVKDVALAANEVPAEALQRTLDLVCAHTGWPVGHVQAPSVTDDGTFISSGIWHLESPERFAPFVEATESLRLPGNGGLVGAAMAAGEAVWVNVQEDPLFLRRTVARQVGLRFGLAVPILSDNRPVAILEFFSEDGKSPSPPFLDSMDVVARQLGSVRDRERVAQERDHLVASLEERVIERTGDLAASVRELEAFAYTVSHDLRAPLRAMDGFSRILLEDFSEELPADAQRYLHRIRENAQEMGDLISHLLDFSRLGRRELTRNQIDMSSVVRQVYEELDSTIGGRVITFRVGALPHIHGDPTLVKQVWANLLGNAVKYTAGRPDAEIEVEALVEAGEPCFCVRDNGVGFEMTYADNVFRIFERLHRAEEFQGTGVGLAIVKRIIERHGGRIWAEAEPGKGASFYFTLGQRGSR